VRRHLKPERERLPPLREYTTLPFSSSAERDAYMAKNADYFTVVCYWGPRNGGYERHEVKTLLEAEKLARRMADKAGRPYMIYAVAGIYDAYVATIKPTGGAVNG